MDIVIENAHLRLTVGSDCIVKSLIHKASGEECLVQDQDISLFSVTQQRPYNNEVKLVYCNKRTTYQANRLRREESKDPRNPWRSSADWHFPGWYR